MQGYSDITELQLETIRGFYQLFTAPPELEFVNLFPVGKSETDEIKWDRQTGARTMVPFKGPGQETPMGAARGIYQESAKCAFWGEKRYYDEEFLNNLRQPGTTAKKQVASQKLAKELKEMGDMSMRRKEWMFAQMLCNDGFTYKSTKNTTITVDYGISSSHQVSVAADKNWDDGANRTILTDIITANRTIRDDCGATAIKAFSNSTVLEYVAKDSDILTLLSKQHGFTSQSGLFQGNTNEIVNANPNVIGSIFNNNLTYTVNDEKYEVRANITGAVTADTTVIISVDDAADFVAGGTLIFTDVSAGTTESETIASVDADAGTITVSTAPSTSYKATEDHVSMFRSYIPDDTLVLFATSVQGQPIAEYIQAPFGVPERYGLYPDTWERRDPEGVWLRVQDKGLPVLYLPEAVYILDVNP